MYAPSRRALLLGTLGLAGLGLTSRKAFAEDDAGIDAEQYYGAVRGEPFAVPAIDLSRINPRFFRTAVDYAGSEPPGTIIIDPEHRFLYLVYEGGQALRYGVGVGRQGFAWSGTAMIHDKREWPDWYPPKEMLARDHSIMAVMSKLQGGIGMPGGPGNPLGARAMYLFQGNKDTLYRIHGTVEPWTIGSSISSGCIRMINQDVMDLYNRVSVGTKVVVLGDAQPASQQTARRQHTPRFDPDDNQDPMVADPQSLPPVDPDQ
jgi:lipoprotein-anchoring transpeptidase ErfK/SrfK